MKERGHSTNDKVRDRHSRYTERPNTNTSYNNHSSLIEMDERRTDYGRSMQSLGFIVGFAVGFCVCLALMLLLL